MGDDITKVAQRSTCRVHDGIQSPPADAAVVVLARVLDDVDAGAGQPYRPVFVQGCSPY
ncbi:hypothetical protein ACLTEW_12675 [Gordonia lacunae]|uniref:hypothetical protein n=1 Tax=Gordonia lacunae TaxID=417102 RepID=UPI0039E2246D